MWPRTSACPRTLVYCTRSERPAFASHVRQGSAPAVWFRRWYGRDFDASKHRWDYERARRLWRYLVPEEQRAAALRERPIPPQVAPRPPITAENAQDFPPPSLLHYTKEELDAPGSAPYIWFKQMTGDDWQPEHYNFAYEIARKRWQRLLPEVRKREREREQTRVRDKGAKDSYCKCSRMMLN